MSTTQEDDDNAPSSSVTQEHGDTRQEAPEVTPQEERAPRTGMLRPLLVRALLASLLIHLSPLLLLLHFQYRLSPVELDTEWFGDFEKLEAIGHGDHFAPQQVQLAVQDEPEEQENLPPTEEPEPPEEAAAKEEPEEPEQEKPAPEKKSDAQPPKEAPQERDREEEKKKPEEEIRTPPAIAAKKEEPRPEEAQETPPPTKAAPETSPSQERAPSRRAEALPGLEYDGPSNLPMLKNYAPGNARMTALIRLDTLRNTPYHKPTNALLSTVPDYRIILASSDTDPVRDFDSIFTASADPRYIQETFLVVKHSLGKQRMQQKLDDRFADPGPWTSYRGISTRDIVPASSPYRDPRKILLPSRDTALVARTEWLSELTNDQPADSSLRPDFEGETPPKFTMLESLEHIANAAPEDTMLLASFQGLYFYLPGYGRLPKMEAVKLSITTPSKPLLTLDLQFATNAQAASFASKCPAMKKKLIGTIPAAVRFIAKIDPYIERLECEASDTYVTIQGEYTQKEFKRAIELASQFLPPAPGLSDLPSPPERAPASPEDMATSPESQPGDMGSDQGADTSPTRAKDMTPGVPPDTKEPAAPQKEGSGAPTRPLDELSKPPSATAPSSPTPEAPPQQGDTGAPRVTKPPASTPSQPAETLDMGQEPGPGSRAD